MNTITTAMFDSSVLDVGAKFTSWQVSDEVSRVLKKSGITDVPRLLLILTIFWCLAQWFVNVFLTFFKASTSYGYFHYVSYGIFAHWFSLDQMFKFSVSFGTEVEKTDHRMDVLIEVFAPQKTQREQPNTFLLQQITYVTWNPCCYHEKLVSLFI